MGPQIWFLAFVELWNIYAFLEFLKRWDKSCRHLDSSAAKVPVKFRSDIETGLPAGLPAVGALT